MRILNFLKKSKYTVFPVILIILTLFYPYSFSLGAVMGSSTYKIQSDSVNFGGVDSSSGTYKVGDTLGEIATENSNSANYYMHAGYWQMDESYLSITTPPDLVMASMGGLSGGSSEGTLSWVVTTDNTAGYSMSIASTTTPALKSATYSLADYVPSVSYPDPDYNFNNLPANSSFGFSPEGTDVTQSFRDNGSVCNVLGGGETTGKCWDGLSTTPKIIAEKTSSNHPSGSTVTARFRAESGANHIQTSGVYSVTIVATATTL